jgi:predicted CoA-binding protein
MVNQKCMRNIKTLVLGASQNPARYSYLALKSLSAKNHPIVAIGKSKGKVDDIEIDNEQKPVNDIDTVTLYLNPNNQKKYYDYILSLHPKRIIFNPGAENLELKKLADKNGIKTMEACTLVLLSTGQY